MHWGKRLVTFHQLSNEKLYLEFDDGSILDDVDLLVGADGIRSAVVQALVNANDNAAGLRYLEIMIILGIANFSHPHLNERGFYTLDGEHRLFTMPYEGSKLDDEKRDASTRRIMWQLSYRIEDEAETKRLSAARPESLRDEVLRRCHGWHQPVADMVKATPLETIWGTGLMDRDPEDLLKRLDLSSSPRVVVLGDAVHPMSPFKGQGANQALTDGPLLASWLQSASIDSAVRSFWREMVQRTAAKVKASREAAAMLHSPECLETAQDFAGVEPKFVKNLLVALKERGMGAGKLGKLDQLVRETIEDLGYGKECKTEADIPSLEYKQLCKQALVFASQGDSIGLRNLSLKSSQAICDARDEKSRSCLHLAVAGGHYQPCRWLLTEAHVSPDAVDDDNRTALDVAIESCQQDIAALLSSGQVIQVESQREICPATVKVPL